MIDTAEHTVKLQAHASNGTVNTADLQQAIAAYSDQSAKGLKTLRKHLHAYTRAEELLKSHAAAIAASIRFLNGERKQTSKAVSKRQAQVAQKFYASLSTTALRQHCTLHKLDFDSYETIDDIIAALVDRQMATE